MSTSTTETCHLTSKAILLVARPIGSGGRVGRPSSARCPAHRSSTPDRVSARLLGCSDDAHGAPVLSDLNNGGFVATRGRRGLPGGRRPHHGEQEANHEIVTLRAQERTLSAFAVAAAKAAQPSIAGGVVARASAFACWGGVDAASQRVRTRHFRHGLSAERDNRFGACSVQRLLRLQHLRHQGLPGFAISEATASTTPGRRWDPATVCLWSLNPRPGRRSAAAPRRQT
jgi:hypothetical protein